MLSPNVYDYGSEVRGPVYGSPVIRVRLNTSLKRLSGLTSQKTLLNLNKNVSDPPEIKQVLELKPRNVQIRVRKLILKEVKSPQKPINMFQQARKFQLSPLF